jgi:hypothetical protein
MALIADKAVNNRAMSKIELSHESNERFAKTIKRGWVARFVNRHAGDLFETKIIP